ESLQEQLSRLESQLNLLLAGQHMTSPEPTTLAALAVLSGRAPAPLLHRPLTTAWSEARPKAPPPPDVARWAVTSTRGGARGAAERAEMALERLHSYLPNLGSLVDDEDPGKRKLGRVVEIVRDASGMALTFIRKQRALFDSAERGKVHELEAPTR